MKVIAGLGNPGLEYILTPHNAGFDVVSVLAERFDAGWRLNRKLEAKIAFFTFSGEKIFLLQPQTYMNLSGRSVAATLNYYGCTASDFVVISDDADLSLGCLRIRKKGGSGGHRGLASIIEALQTDVFVRVRIGVGRRVESDNLAGYVLGKWDATRLEVANECFKAAADAALECATGKVDIAMNRWNSWLADGAAGSVEEGLK